MPRPISLPCASHARHANAQLNAWFAKRHSHAVDGVVDPFLIKASARIQGTSTLNLAGG